MTKKKSTIASITVWECPACPGWVTKPGTCSTMGCGRNLVARTITTHKKPWNKK